MKRALEVKLLRVVRKIHRWLGITLFVMMILVAGTGFLLGWKKNLVFVQQPTRTGTGRDLSHWLPMDSLVKVSNQALATHLGDVYDLEIDKIDAYPSKGIIKTIYISHYYSCQIDAYTGEVLSVEYRMSDLVEHLHDGSWVDRQMGWGSGTFKLIYTTTASGGLLLFALTGFWLWIGPKKLRSKR